MIQTFKKHRCVQQNLTCGSNDNKVRVLDLTSNMSLINPNLQVTIIQNLKLARIIKVCMQTQNSNIPLQINATRCCSLAYIHPVVKNTSSETSNSLCKLELSSQQSCTQSKVCKISIVPEKKLIKHLLDGNEPCQGQHMTSLSIGLANETQPHTKIIFNWADRVCGINQGLMGHSQIFQIHSSIKQHTSFHVDSVRRR